MSAARKKGRCGQAACGVRMKVGDDMTLDHGHRLTQVSLFLWGRLVGDTLGPGAAQDGPLLCGSGILVCLRGGASGGVGRRGSGGKAGSVGAHLARGTLPALPGSGRKSGVLVAEKIDSEENPCCPLTAAGTDEQ